MAWAEEWIAVCFELQQNTAPSPSEREAIHQAVDRMRASGIGRSLTHFCAEVQSTRIREAMHHYTLDGALGRLLDAVRR